MHGFEGEIRQFYNSIAKKRPPGTGDGSPVASMHGGSTALWRPSHLTQEFPEYSSSDEKTI